MDEIITFRSLSQDDFVKIAAIMMGDLKKAVVEHGLDLSWTDAALKYISEKSYSVKFGARNMRRFITKNVEDPAAEKLINGYANGYKLIEVDSDGETLTVDVK